MVDSDLDSITFESLPRRSARHRAIRAAANEPPEGQEKFDACLPQFGDPGRSRMPRVLTGMRVLVVDDDEDTVDLFATALTACGADVATATNAPDATAPSHEPPIGCRGD
jgi:PleD family two-component response regulator